MVNMGVWEISARGRQKVPTIYILAEDCTGIEHAMIVIRLSPNVLIQLDFGKKIY